MSETPQAARRKPTSADARPDFLIRLGVLLPCNEEDVKAAYRAKVRAAHPDTGGSADAFRQLEEDYQNALHYAELQSGRLRWLAPRIERYAAQQEFIAAIRRRGGAVETSTIDWLKREIGDDFAQVLDTIVAIRLNGPAIAIRDIRFLCSHRIHLAGLKRLDLSGAHIGNSSVELLRQLESVSELDLSGTFISNSAAKRLAEMPALKHVNVGHTFLGGWGRWMLRARRPDVLIDTAATRKSIARRRFTWAAAAVLVYVAICFTATHMPQDHVPPWEFAWFDKFAHFGVFSVLGFMMGWLFSLRAPGHEHSGRRTWFYSALAILLAAAYGLLDEHTQPAFGREYDLMDWAADVAGASFGVAVFAVVHWVLRLRSVHKTADNPFLMSAR